VGEHAHLSSAVTAHTVLSEVTSAAGVDAGMTGGRERNRLYVVATGMADPSSVGAGRSRAPMGLNPDQDEVDDGIDGCTVEGAAGQERAYVEWADEEFHDETAIQSVPDLPSLFGAFEHGGAGCEAFGVEVLAHGCVLGEILAGGELDQEPALRCLNEPRDFCQELAEVVSE